MSSKIPILLYHDLDSPEIPNEKKEAASRDTVVKANNFESQLRFLKEQGYESISLGEYFEFRERSEILPPSRITITFDDGHHSNSEIAVPLLLKYGFKATFFIIAGRIDKEHHLSRAQIRQMIDQGMEIGSHGYTHRYLPLLEDKEIEFELTESQKFLEAITGRSVKYFAFPGGHYDKRVLKTHRHPGCSN